MKLKHMKVESSTLLLFITFLTLLLCSNTAASDASLGSLKGSQKMQTIFHNDNEHESEQQQQLKQPGSSTEQKIKDSSAITSMLVRSYNIFSEGFSSFLNKGMNNRSDQKVIVNNHNSDASSSSATVADANAYYPQSITHTDKRSSFSDLASESSRYLDATNEVSTLSPLLPSELNIWQNLYDTLNGNEWECTVSRDTPCSTAVDGDVNCADIYIACDEIVSSGSTYKTVSHISLPNNNLNGTFNPLWIGSFYNLQLIDMRSSTNFVPNTLSYPSKFSLDLPNGKCLPMPKCGSGKTACLFGGSGIRVCNATETRSPTSNDSTGVAGDELNEKDKKSWKAIFTSLQGSKWISCNTTLTQENPCTGCPSRINCIEERSTSQYLMIQSINLSNIGAQGWLPDDAVSSFVGLQHFDISSNSLKNLVCLNIPRCYSYIPNPISCNFTSTSATLCPPPYTKMPTVSPTATSYGNTSAPTMATFSPTPVALKQVNQYDLSAWHVLYDALGGGDTIIVDNITSAEWLACGNITFRNDPCSINSVDPCGKVLQRSINCQTINGELRITGIRLVKNRIQNKWFPALAANALSQLTVLDFSNTATYGNIESDKNNNNFTNVDCLNIPRCTRPGVHCNFDGTGLSFCGVTASPSPYLDDCNCVIDLNQTSSAQGVHCYIKVGGSNICTDYVEGKECPILYGLKSTKCGHPVSNITDPPSVNSTFSPTMLPVYVLTTSPTQQPSAQPTGRFTRIPTPSPTANYTASPTLSPNHNSTEIPTSNYTLSPTAMNYTDAPTTNITYSPSVIWTQQPSHSPSLNYTSSPTYHNETWYPTLSPSFNYTASPTQNNETWAPTAFNFTNSPTSAPTAMNYTAAPTNTNITESPTHYNYTNVPTFSPIFNYTASPTYNNNTWYPTLSPTVSNYTASPTYANVTNSPTTSPTIGNYTASPTFNNITQAPTHANYTESPTHYNYTNVPTLSPSFNYTTSPTQNNETWAPTSYNFTNSPTSAPTAMNYTAAPTNTNITESPTYNNNTWHPTLSPTANDFTASPTIYNFTASPTLSPTTSNQTLSPPNNSTRSPTSSPIRGGLTLNQDELLAWQSFFTGLQGSKWDACGSDNMYNFPCIYAPTECSETQHRVVCSPINGELRITIIILPNNNLRGWLPDTAINLMKSLRFLDLSNSVASTGTANLFGNTKCLNIPGCSGSIDCNFQHTSAEVCEGTFSPTKAPVKDVGGR